ncbi:ABC transporter permease [Glaciibacter psychrotolerans]|uniref:Peptide/nickel transport system permease protein n=1 Tax=Glaciibacter psychrotolerans TaxID=670054 RepID=A0A7Z0EI89_9MICO|nr:ABC transporter permease [Leifsonia psychrotolerans]NYJ21344.1 peptide/nickel transport system permease protein [Leifsonia psychrotolerans]
MKRFGLRALHLFVVLILVTFLVSVMLEFLPGDPAVVIAGENATPEQVELVRQKLNLDQPVIARYFLWASHVLQGDLGVSFRTTQPVGEAIAQRLPVSLELMVLAQIIALIMAVPMAVWAAYRPRSTVGRIATPTSVLMISTPEFVIALMLILGGAMVLGWFPATGFVPLAAGLGLNLISLALPALAVAAEPAGTYSRILRADMSRTFDEDFMLAAKAKGMTIPNILFRQALRPSSLSLVTLAGLNTARLLGSVVVIESLFGIPGIGRLLVESVNNSDFVTVQGVVCVIALTYVIVNALTDLSYAIIDPRVRHAVA